MPPKTESFKEGLGRVKPHLRFIFLTHDRFPDDPTDLLQALSDRDLIFLEAVSIKATTSRSKIEETFNLVLSPPEKLDQNQKHHREIILEKFRQENGLLAQLAVHLAGSGKQIVLVDIDPSHDCHPLIGQSERLRQSIVASLMLGKIDTAHQYHQIYVSTKAKLHAQRESVVHQQIEDYLKSASGAEIKAAVIQGLIHTPTVSLFDHDRYQIESLILNQSSSLEYQLWLSKRLGQEITEIDYQRSLLGEVLLDSPVLARRLSPEQVQGALRQFEIIYKQKLARLSNRRRLTEEEKETYGLYAFNQTIIGLLSTIKLWLGD